MRGLLNRVSSHFSVSQLFPRIRIDEVQYRLRNYYIRRQEECEDEIVLNEENNLNTNENFMKEKDIKFRLYPFYINWKKIEENEKGYYRTFIHFGFFGASIYSLYKEKFPELDFKNIIYVLSSFIYEYLIKGNDDYSEDEIKNFFEKLPKVDEIYGLIKKKILLMKEVPVILIVLKIYEIHFILQKNKKEIETTLKCEYILGTYLTDDEYHNIYKNHFKGSISRIFMKIANNIGKEHTFPKTKMDYCSHIKSIYKKFIKK
jgi:hypothetical protein